MLILTITGEWAAAYVAGMPGIMVFTIVYLAAAGLLILAFRRVRGKLPL